MEALSLNPILKRRLKCPRREPNFSAMNQVIERLPRRFEKEEEYNTLAMIVKGDVELYVTDVGGSDDAGHHVLAADEPKRPTSAFLPTPSTTSAPSGRRNSISGPPVGTCTRPRFTLSTRTRSWCTSSSRCSTGPTSAMELLLAWDAIHRAGGGRRGGRAHEGRGGVSPEGDRSLGR
ncbi:hypothetical protein Cni_G10054 [Canna indica]|uniref:Uncharacterized protein n=1 Tax=Canna indica TaxID=4628 RepID=A0AAQ3K3L5_9LILI|nr:hypothetical protein Cni_G10054 [Canna indica]